MFPDLLALLPLGVAVLLVTLLSEWAVRRAWLPYWISRKILHVVAVGCCAIAPYWVTLHASLIAIVLPAWLLLLFLISRRQLMREESGRPAWGIVWFPLSYLILLGWFGPDDDFSVAFPMAVLAICDPLATIGGKLLARRTYRLTGEPKSLIGNLAFFLGFIGLAILFDVSLPWSALLAVGLLVTYAEALGSYGRDNLYVPLLTAILLFAAQRPAFHPEYYVIAAAPFVWATVRYGKLSPGGAGAATLLGIVVGLSTGPVSLLPLFVFFGGSVLVGRLFSNRELSSDSKDRQPRDAIQVLANGGGYACLSIMALLGETADFEVQNTHPRLFIAMLVSMAVATSDTWSSEVGKHFRGPTYDLGRGRPVPPGLSGGVSRTGSLAGWIGALTIGLLAALLLPQTERLPGFLLVTGFGFSGMLVDSLLGSYLQRQYFDGDRWWDTPPKKTLATRGFAWMTNDLVNLVANLLTVGCFLLLWR